MSSSVANNQHLQLTRQLILHIFPAQKLRLASHFRKKKFEKIFLAHNCLKRIITKNREKKNRKIIFGSELSETNNEQTFRLYQKNDEKSRKKIDKLLSNNEQTF